MKIADDMLTYMRRGVLSITDAKIALFDSKARPTWTQCGLFVDAVVPILRRWIGDNGASRCERCSSGAVGTISDTCHRRSAACRPVERIKPKDMAAFEAQMGIPMNPKNDDEDCDQIEKNGPLDAASRATGAFAHLCTAKTKAAKRRGWGGWTPPGWPANNQNPNGSYIYHRGHLLGNQFGGTQKPDNVVTMYARANTPVMRDFENLVAADLKGDNLYYVVVPIYGRGNSNGKPIAIDILERTDHGGCRSDLILNTQQAPEYRDLFCP